MPRMRAAPSRADELRILAVGADADVRAVALGEDVQHRGEVDVHAEPPQLAALDEALPLHEVRVARGAGGELVGEDGHPLR